MRGDGPEPKPLVFIGSSRRDLREMPEEVAISSGNVFADLGLPNPEERLAQAHLILRIEEILEEQGLSDQQAAQRMGIGEPELSSLLRGRVEGFPLDRLMRCLRALDQDVRIVVRPKQHGEARLSVGLA